MRVSPKMKTLDFANFCWKVKKINTATTQENKRHGFLCHAGNAIRKRNIDARERA